MYTDSDLNATELQEGKKKTQNLVEQIQKLKEELNDAKRGILFHSFLFYHLNFYNFHHYSISQKPFLFYLFHTTILIFEIYHYIYANILYC